MRFLLDSNLSPRVALLLRAAGLDAQCDGTTAAINPARLPTETNSPIIPAADDLTKLTVPWLDWYAQYMVQEQAGHPG